MDDQLVHHGCVVWVLVVLICDFKTCLGILGESGGGWRSCTKLVHGESAKNSQVAAFER